MNDGFVGLVDGARRVEDGLPLPTPVLLQSLDATQPDDTLLDSWLASLTPNQFEHILNALARPPMTRMASAG